MALAAKLERLICDSELRHKMRPAGRKRYEENFAVEKFRGRMENVIVNACMSK